MASKLRRKRSSRPKRACRSVRSSAIVLRMRDVRAWLCDASCQAASGAYAGWARMAASWIAARATSVALACEMAAAWLGLGLGLGRGLGLGLGFGLGVGLMLV